jgi:hypothetical protein
VSGLAPTARVVGVLAVLTVREAARRRVIRSLVVLTAVLLGLSAWGFSKLAGVESDAGALDQRRGPHRGLPGCSTWSCSA